MLRGRAELYAKRRINWPKDEYKVVAGDAVEGDGVYYVKARTSWMAIDICRKRYKIQLTQSFCGTSFTATKLKEWE